MELDTRMGNAGEAIARKLSRRKMLATGVKGGVATLAAAFVGERIGLKDAFAAYCPCTWANGNRIYGCSQGGCPAGWSICTTSTYPVVNGYGCDGWCNYAYPGDWVSCSGLGGGLGYKVCTDCNSAPCDYGYTPVGTCLSDCLNCEAR